MLVRCQADFIAARDLIFVFSSFVLRQFFPRWFVESCELQVEANWPKNTT
jgi:hypothetical protein